MISVSDDLPRDKTYRTGEFAVHSRKKSLCHNRMNARSDPLSETAALFVRNSVAGRCNSFDYASMESIPFLHLLPCLRCGCDSVPVSLILGIERRETVSCLARNCGAEHYLEIRRTPVSVEVIYDRHTLRYPLEYYDAGKHPVVRLKLARCGVTEDSEEGFRGPIAVYHRKKHFNRHEVLAVWKASGGRCHLCRRKWGAGQRSRSGWHIDHVIPNVGGGVATEQTENFRVACARCNLRKGRGHTPKRLLVAIRNLVERLAPSSHKARKKHDKGTPKVPFG